METQKTIEEVLYSGRFVITNDKNNHHFIWPLGISLTCIAGFWAPRYNIKNPPCLYVPKNLLRIFTDEKIPPGEMRYVDWQAFVKTELERRGIKSAIRNDESVNSLATDTATKSVEEKT